MATPIVVAGFEHGTTAGFATGNSTNKYFDRTVGTLGTNLSVSSSAARTGTYGLRLSPSAATVHAGFQNSGNGGILGSSGTLVGSFYFRFPTLPSADFNIFIDIGTAGGNDVFIKYLNSTGGLQGVFGSATQLGPIISANTWYRVDFRAVHNANPHTLDWKIDGVDQTQVSLAVASENIFIAGFGLDNANATGTLDIDDVVLSLTSGDYPLGDNKVVLLLPDTGGTTTEIGTANATSRMVTNSALDATHNSANILAAISEVPLVVGGSASGLGQRTSGTGNACQVPMTTYTLTGGETITGLRVNCPTWAASTTANNLGIRAHNGTAETTLFAAADYNGDTSSTPAWICKMYTGVTDQTTLDALNVRVGYSADISPLPAVHAIYVEVAVLAGTATKAPILRRDPHRGLYMR